MKSIIALTAILAIVSGTQSVTFKNEAAGNPLLPKNIKFVGEADGKYFFTDPQSYINGTSFLDAMEYCHKNNVFPAVITSEAQNQAVINGLGQYHPFWLPLTDIGSEGTFRWIRTGEAVTFTNWLPGHPARSSEDGNVHRNCAYVYPATNNDGSWLNINCSTKWRPLCEWP